MSKKVTRAGRPAFPPHEKRVNKTVRVNEMHWDLARERARKEGYTMQDVMREFVEAYATSKLHMPKIVKEYK